MSFSNSICNTSNSPCLLPDHADPCSYSYVIRGKQTQPDGIETLIGEGLDIQIAEE